MPFYNNLSDLFCRHSLVQSEFDSSLEQHLQSISTALKQTFEQASESAQFNQYQTILFYIADIADFDNYIQAFAKNQEDPPAYWDFRGTICEQLSPHTTNPVGAFFDRIVSMLEINYAEENPPEGYPMWGIEHPIYTQELDLYIADKVAAFFGECFQSVKHSWQNVWLDFLPDRDFHQAEVYDLIHQKWIALPR